MRTLTFAQMVAGAEAAGVAAEACMGQWGQVCSAVSYQDVLMATASPCLEGALLVHGADAWCSAVTCWVVQGEEAVPLTLHVGLSEGGCAALYRGRLFTWPTARDPVEVPGEIWAALQLSVWCSPE